MLLVPKVFILVMAALLIGFALLLLYLTTKFCMFVKDLKEKEDVSEIGIPEAIDRFWEQRASESRWIN